MIELLKLLASHIQDKAVVYILAGVVIFGIGWQGNALADYFLTKQVEKIVLAQIAPLQEQLALIVETQKEDRVAFLDDKLLDTRRKQCQAILENNVQAKLFYATRMQELKNQYFEATEPRRVWDTPPCETL